MANAQGTAKTLAYKKQTALGTAASGSGGQLLRRRTATFNLTRETYQNDEIASHRQSTGAVAGLKRVAGELNGLFSPDTYADLLQSLLMRDFTTLTAASSVSLTIAASGSLYTVTRAAGSFLTDGFKIGHVIRLSVGTLNAANINRNLLIVALTATVATVKPLNSGAMAAEGPISGCTVTMIGKQTYAPPSSHTDDWYTFEQWYSDLSRSETFTDVKVAGAQMNLPATGNCELNLSFIGLGRTLGASQVLTSPTAETTTGVASAVTGVCVVNGTPTTITGANISLSGAVSEGEADLGSSEGQRVRARDARKDAPAQVGAEVVPRAPR